MFTFAFSASSVVKGHLLRPYQSLILNRVHWGIASHQQLQPEAPPQSQPAPA
jgi:hypothetical protein